MGLFDMVTLPPTLSLPEFPASADDGEWQTDDLGPSLDTYRITADDHRLERRVPPVARRTPDGGYTYDYDSEPDAWRPVHYTGTLTLSQMHRADTALYTYTATLTNGTLDEITFTDRVELDLMTPEDILSEES